MNKFVIRMLELGAELDKAVSPIEISMMLNDAEILYKNHIEQLTIPRVVNCKHENYTPCYGREGELMFKQCDTCGEEFD